MFKIYLFIFIFMYSQAIAGFNEVYKQTDTNSIKQHLTAITKTKISRNYKNIATLNFVAGYIYKEFSKYCDTVFYQTYKVNGIEYKNVIGSIGYKKIKRIVVGAHYDVHGETEGADDNASGVVGLLELARLLSGEVLNHRIDLLAYSLEEPPYFRTENMGSYVHAKSLHDQNVQILGMICLEMIGCFSNQPKSQTYPLKFLKLFYGNTGDFITVVQKFSNGRFGRQVKHLMKGKGMLKTKSFQAPTSLPGIDFSDHQNYWKFNYSALMISNTAFYRNKNYHQASDKMETLDLMRMALVIDQVFFTLKKIK